MDKATQRLLTTAHTLATMPPNDFAAWANARDRLVDAAHDWHDLGCPDLKEIQDARSDRDR